MLFANSHDDDINKMIYNSGNSTNNPCNPKHTTMIIEYPRLTDDGKNIFPRQERRPDARA